MSFIHITSGGKIQMKMNPVILKAWDEFANMDKYQMYELRKYLPDYIVNTVMLSLVQVYNGTDNYIHWFQQLKDKLRMQHP